MVNKVEILPLTSFRFVAAFYVFIFHCQIHYGTVTSITIVNKFISYGYLGMVMFFILSGYILSYNYKEFNNKKQIKDFYINRIARIYPIYFVYGLIGFPIFLLTIDSIDSVYDVESIQIILSLLAFVFMIQAWFPTLFNIWNFGGSWSLSMEAFFYLLFPIIRYATLNVSDKTLKIVLFLSFLLGSIPVLYLYAFNNTVQFPIIGTYIYCNPMMRIGEFVFGVVLFVLAKERKAIDFNKYLFLVLIIIFAILATNITSSSLSNLNFIFIPIIALFILYLHNTKMSLFSNPVLLFLGKISYSFYLAQFFVFALIKTEILSFDISMIYKWLLAFSITISISIFMYYFVEIPARKYIKIKLEVK